MAKLVTNGMFTCKCVQVRTADTLDILVLWSVMVCCTDYLYVQITDIMQVKRDKKFSNHLKIILRIKLLILS